MNQKVNLWSKVVREKPLKTLQKFCDESRQWAQPTCFDHRCEYYVKYRSNKQKESPVSVFVRDKTSNQKGTYKTLWSEAHEELSCVLAGELSEEPVRDRGKFFQRLATLYVLYLQIFRKLEEAYDQSVHPQKRRVMRQLLEGVMGRILELKSEMVENDFSEYHYMDDIIQDLKLIPAMNPILPNPSTLKLAVQNNEANRRMRQEEYEDDYQKSTSSVTELLWQLEGQEMKDIMKDQIRQWFIECRKKQKKKASKRGKWKKNKTKRISHRIGDYSYLGTTPLQSGIEPKPSLSDVRQVVALYAVLPLGSQAVHEKAPLVKSMLLVGPSGVGKKMLVHAICQETGANLFDLSPSNVSGKYPGKSGLQMMLQMVFMVARLMQPSVIWIGDAEKMFYKNVPKDEKELDPKRLTKNLSEILKSIKGEDCVLIVGTTNDPQSAELESLCEFYNKIILIPRSDYASRYRKLTFILKLILMSDNIVITMFPFKPVHVFTVIWRELIRDNGGEVTSNLDLSFLTKISEGCTPGHMVKVVRCVLSEHRIQQVPRRPLTASEFVSPLAGVVPEFQDEEEALKVNNYPSNVCHDMISHYSLLKVVM
ncbi:IQ and AAA domain-containing protein 1 [Triplophysa tibetana]|uniref:IQ and AAA domain-containing protein 1 n=1 Tax=Triplophysa tibetana TaxID=1572043 RepID=A0A5A9NW01_9TELE|nr:IQ and AAA domain-containing protein 1 [Triplophysa tibetana]